VALAFLYGENDYLHSVEFKGTPLYQVSHSVGAFFTDNKLVYDAKTNTYKLGSLKLIQRNLGHNGEAKFLHPDEPMANDQAQATCSFALVGKNLVLTAGHCIMSKDRNFAPTQAQFKKPKDIDCSKTKFQFAFNYRQDRVNQDGSINFDKNDVYSCKRVRSFAINWAVMENTHLDYALIELDREVEGRLPLALASDEVKAGDLIATIGHPSSTTQKINNRGVIMQSRTVDRGHYAAEIDGLPGISGAPVFNLRTGEIIGVFVKAAHPFYLNMRRHTFEPDDEFLFFHGVPRMGVSQNKNPSQILKSTELLHLVDDVNRENYFADQFDQYVYPFENEINSETIIQNTLPEHVIKLKEIARTQLSRKTSNENLVKIRWGSKIMNTVNSQLNRPISWGIGFLRGVFTANKNQSIEVNAINALLSRNANMAKLSELIKAVQSREEYDELINEFVQNQVVPFLAQELSIISQILPAESVLTNARQFKNWLASCEECENFVGVTKINYRSFYQELKLKSVSFKTVDEAKQYLNQFIEKALDAKKLTKNLTSFGLTSLATLSMLPVPALQISSGITQAQCFSQKARLRLNWLSEVEKIKLIDVSLYLQFLADDEMKLIYEDLNHHQHHCTEFVLKSYNQLQSSRIKGNSSALKLKEWIRGLRKK
jgi:V8-like Glu-specific endopeptidase